MKQGDYVFTLPKRGLKRHGVITEVEYVSDTMYGDNILYHVAFNDYPKNWFEMQFDEDTGIFTEDELLIDRNYKNVYEI